MKFFLAIRTTFLHDLSVGGRWKAGQLVEARMLHIAFFKNFTSHSLFLPITLAALFCNACQAKPVAADKATPVIESPHQVEIQSQIVFTGAAVRGLGDEILFYPPVKECLRKDLDVHREPGWRMVFSAVLNAQGAVQELSFSAASSELERCLRAALAHFSSANPSPSVFTLTIERAPSDGPPAGKTLLLDLFEGKKLQ